MMFGKIFNQVMRSVALAGAMPNDDNPPRSGDSLRDAIIIRRIFMGALTPLARLTFVRQVMQEMMGIIGTDILLGRPLGRQVGAKNTRLMMIDHDQQIRCRDRQGGWPGGGKARGTGGGYQKMPQVTYFLRRQILRMRTVQDMLRVADHNHVFMVWLLGDAAKFFEEMNDIVPFQIMGRRVMKQCVISSAVRAGQKWRRHCGAFWVVVG